MTETIIKILIIEDDSGIYTLLKRKLEEHRFNVKLSQTGKAAIELLENEEIDLILLDYILPDKTASEIIDILHSKGIHIPFIITTGQGSEKIAVELMKQGALDYVTKDIHFWDFIIPSIKRTAEKLITEKQLNQTKHALLESEQRLRQIIDLVPYYICSKRSNGEILFANKSYLQSFVKENKGFELLNSFEEKALNSFEIQDISEEVVGNLNGKNAIFKSSYIPYTDDETGENCVLSIKIDITRQKWIEEEIKSLNTELEQRVQTRTNEIEEKTKELIKLDKVKDDILNIVAHDLRSPLMSILGSTQIIKLKNSDLNPENEKLLEHINLSCKTMDNLINDLLDVSKIESDNYRLVLEKVELNSILNDIEIHFDSLFKRKDITFHLFSVENIYLMLHKERFWQVIQNLISNAIKFTNQGGEISLKVVDEIDNVKLHIKDNGIGISEDYLDILFEKFTPASRKGTEGEHSTGLGMSICKRILELHHGNINVQSIIGEGTEFIITLPK